MALLGTDLLVRRPEVDANPLPDQTVLLFQKDTSLAVPVNQSGAAIWEMCDGAHTVDQIVDNLAETYDQERSRIEQDVRAFLDELIAAGIRGAAVLITTAPHKIERADSFCIYDFPFRLRSNVPDVQSLIAGLYRNFLAPSVDGPVAEAIIERESEARFSWRFVEKAGVTATLPGALWNLEAALCETIIRSQRRSIAIHAATIPVGDSMAMLAGCSQAGKTTLSLALARRGFPVAGDDVALVDPETLNVSSDP